MKPRRVPKFGAPNVRHSLYRGSDSSSVTRFDSAAEMKPSFRSNTPVNLPAYLCGEDHEVPVGAPSEEARMLSRAEARETHPL